MLTKTATKTPTLQNTCAIIVTFQPDEDFHNRLVKISAQFPATVIVDNGSRSLPHTCASEPNTLLIANQSNLGIAAALNQGVKLAHQKGFEWVVTLDQDTLVSCDLLTCLISVYEKSGYKNIIIGSNYWDAHRRQDFIPCANAEADFRVRKTLITSGTLIPLSLFKTIGFFREDYFIDSVDHEFCLRARAHGYKILITCRSIMSQSIGAHVENPSRLRQFMSFNHSPMRKYFIARNTVATAKLYFLQEPMWSLRQGWRLFSDFASIILFEHQKLKKATAFMVGLTHGIMGKMGPIEDTWPNGIR